MKKIKLTILIIAVALMCCGVAYAKWTEQVEFDFNIKTAQAELEIMEAKATRARVESTGKCEATIQAKEIQPGECVTVDITCRNTGSIPVDFDSVVISGVGGYSSENKDMLHLDIFVNADGKKIIDCSMPISHWKTNKRANITGLAEIPVGGAVTIKVQIRMEKNEDNIMANESKENIFEDVMFILTPEYSRFNED